MNALGMTTHRVRLNIQLLAIPAALVAGLAIGSASVTVVHTSAPTVAEMSGGDLSPQQVVIRGEVADRASTQAGDLSPQQVVIRGEVADRMK